jgi:two-component system sensor histidine kinase GlrK
LRDLIDNVINAQRLAIVAKSITVKRECEKITFPADAEKLRVVIDNLLSNAIKYSPIGGTVILRLGKHKEHAVIEVIDTGPGIASEDRDRIFDPFYRGKNVAASAIKGSGLGLAIVRDYVEMHQGTVSAIGAAGAHFRVVLPKLPSAQ